MDALPCELLVDIFSLLDVGHLFEVRHVCTRWQTIIDERRGVWRWKRTITEDDLGVYRSLEGKLTRLIYFLKKLPSVDYFFFPVLQGYRKPKWQVYGITMEAEECLKQLYVLLKELFLEGRIPVHLDAVNFIENMIANKWKKYIDPNGWEQSLFDSDQFDSECSVSKCRSIVVPLWPPDRDHVKPYGRWLKYLIGEKMPHLEEIVIERMITHSYAVKYNKPWPKLRVKTWTDRVTDKVLAPSRIRVLSVVGDHHHELSCFLPSVRLRPDRQLFTYDEFAHLLKKLRKVRMMDGLMLFLEKLQAEGRVHDCQIGESDHEGHLQVNIKDLLSCFHDEQVKHEYKALLRRMAISPINQLTVDVLLPDPCEQPASSSLDFLRAHPFQGVTRLSMGLKLPAEDKSSDAGLLHAWDCLLQRDILTRLDFLRVYVGEWYDNRKRGSRVLTAPVRIFPLPRLETLELCEPGSVMHACALLRATPNLRCLTLSLYGLAGSPSEQERVAFRDMLLSAISQLTRLVSLTVKLSEPDDSVEWTRNWEWVTGSSGRAQLSDEVIIALSRLVHLDSLSLDFTGEKNKFRFSSSSWEPDKQRLTALLPRLRVVVLCSRLLNENPQKYGY